MGIKRWESGGARFGREVHKDAAADIVFRREAAARYQARPEFWRGHR